MHASHPWPSTCVHEAATSPSPARALQYRAPPGPVYVRNEGTSQTRVEKLRKCFCFPAERMEIVVAQPRCHADFLDSLFARRLAQPVCWLPVWHDHQLLSWIVGEEGEGRTKVEDLDAECRLCFASRGWGSAWRADTCQDLDSQRKMIRAAVRRQRDWREITRLCERGPWCRWDPCRVCACMWQPGCVKWRVTEKKQKMPMVNVVVVRTHTLDSKRVSVWSCFFIAILSLSQSADCVFKLDTVADTSSENTVLTWRVCACFSWSPAALGLNWKIRNGVCCCDNRECSRWPSESAKLLREERTFLST